MLISDVGVEKNIGRIAIIGVRHLLGSASEIFTALAKNNISVDIILQSIGRTQKKDISFTVAKSDLEKAKQTIEENRNSIIFDKISVDDSVAKISVLGAGMASNPGIAAMFFESLFKAGINIDMISTSEIKIAVLVPEQYADAGAEAVRNRFIAENMLV
jgi:aspartate kinase